MVDNNGLKIIEDSFYFVSSTFPSLQFRFSLKKCFVFNRCLIALTTRKAIKIVGFAVKLKKAGMLSRREGCNIQPLLFCFVFHYDLFIAFF